MRKKEGGMGRQSDICCWGSGETVVENAEGKYVCVRERETVVG